MIGIDANVLVRYIVQDDAKQSKTATHYIESHCSISSPGFINSIVLCEIVWILESAYEYSRNDIATVLEKILSTRQFHIHESELMWRCLQGYKEIQPNTAVNTDKIKKLIVLSKKAFCILKLKKTNK